MFLRVISRHDEARAKGQGRLIWVLKWIAHGAGLYPRRYSRPEQEAYWINVYNALSVDLVLARYPVKSIREIGGG